MKHLPSAFYGDTTRWFIGVVEEVGTDEPKLGRVRVRIFGIHGDQSDIDTADLPFAQVLVPTTEPGVSGLGKNPLLHPGAHVFGIFVDGKNSQLPLIIGSIPHIETPTNEQLFKINAESDPGSAITRFTGSVTPSGGSPGSDGKTASIESALRRGLDGLTTAARAITTQLPTAVSNDDGRRIQGVQSAIQQINSIIPSGIASRFSSFFSAVSNAIPDVVANLPKGSNTQIAWEYFTRTLKYDNTHAAAIIGNLLTASGPGDINTGRIGAFYGIVGWVLEGSRGEDLQVFSQERKRRISDLFLQLQFIDWELANRPTFKGGEFFKIKSLPQAAAFFQHAYMEPTFVNDTGKNIDLDAVPKWSILKDDGTRDLPTIADIKQVDPDLGLTLETQQKRVDQIDKVILPRLLREEAQAELEGNVSEAESKNTSIFSVQQESRNLKIRIEQNIRVATNRLFFNLQTFILVAGAPAPSISEFAVKSGVLGIPDFRVLNETETIDNAKKVFLNFSRNSSGGNV